MKYMLWKDLEPGDILQFTDEYLKSGNIYFANMYENRNLTIYKIIYGEDFIEIYSDDIPHYINYEGITIVNGTRCLKFKLIKLKEEQ